MPEFKFEIKGVTLNMDDMNRIKEQYEIYCTAEFLMENYPIEEPMALRLASDIRDIMDETGCDEIDAVHQVFYYEGLNFNEED